MAVVRVREPSLFWRRARRDRQRAIQPVGPALPPGAIVRVPGRGDVFVRYSAGPPGAPTVLLLHGWMASADLNWPGTFEALAGRCHVLAMDVRGHGRGIRSTEPFSLEDCADDAAGLLRELGVREAVVVGYSMGGAIGLLMARRHPGRVRGLVLVASAAELARTGLGRGLTAAVHLLGALVRSGRARPGAPRGGAQPAGGPGRPGRARAVDGRRGQAAAPGRHRRCGPGHRGVRRPALARRAGRARRVGGHVRRPGRRPRQAAGHGGGARRGGRRGRRRPRDVRDRPGGPGRRGRPARSTSWSPPAAARRERWRVRAVVRRRRADEMPGEPADALDVAV